MAGDPQHYFDRSPTSASRRRMVALVLPDVTFELSTDAGVFSAERIDSGTKLLLLDGPPAPTGAGHLLDLGCGYGPIALTLAHRAPAATVWAVDVNERARSLCAENAEAAGLANVRVVAPDDLPPEVTFDGLWSNPPIRIGKAALHDLLGAWLGRLRTDGQAALVVQKHLGADSLARWLTDAGWPTERIGSRQAYRLLRITAPRAGPGQG